MKIITLKTLFWIITLTLAALTAYVAFRGYLLWYTAPMIGVVTGLYLISLIPHYFGLKLLKQNSVPRWKPLLGSVLFGLFGGINLFMIYSLITEIQADHHWAFG